MWKKYALWLIVLILVLALFFRFYLSHFRPRRRRAIHGLFMSIHPLLLWDPSDSLFRSEAQKQWMSTDVTITVKCVGTVFDASLRHLCKEYLSLKKRRRLIRPIMIEARAAAGWAEQRANGHTMKYRRRCYRYRPRAACLKPIIKLAWGGGRKESGWSIAGGRDQSCRRTASGNEGEWCITEIAAAGDSRQKRTTPARRRCVELH